MYASFYPPYIYLDGKGSKLLIKYQSLYTR